MRRETGEKNLCLAGGVALNCVANGKVFREQIFDRIWVQPASGDAGGALGAAQHIAHTFYDAENPPLQDNLDRQAEAQVQIILLEKLRLLSKHTD